MMSADNEGNRGERRRAAVGGLFAFIAFFILFSVGVDGATTIQLWTAEIDILNDNWVDEGNADANLGDGTYIQVQDTSNDRARGFVQFNITSVPSGQVMDDAQLCLFGNYGGSNIDTEVYRVLSGVYTDEGSVTWNAQPCGTEFDQAGSCNLTMIDSKSSFADASFNCYNVTQGVNVDYSNSESNITFVIKTDEADVESTTQAWRSKDWGTAAQRPYLNITYSAAAGDTDAPDLNFVSPTGANLSTTQNESYIYVNVSGGESLFACVLDWDGTNSTMTVSGSTCYINQTGLTNQTQYNFTVFGNDTAGNNNISESRSITVNTTNIPAAPNLNFILKMRVRDTVAGTSRASYASLCFYVNETLDECYPISKDKDYGEISVTLENLSYGDYFKIVVNGTADDGVYLSNIRLEDTSSNRVSFTPMTFAGSTSDIRNVTVSDSHVLLTLPRTNTGSMRYANYTSATVSKAADFQINQSDMTFNDTIYSIDGSESINITVRVTNAGSATGTGVVQLTANDVFVENKSISIVNGSSSNVTFTYTVNFNSKNILKLKVDALINNNLTEGLSDDNYAVKYLVEDRPYMMFSNYSLTTGSVYSDVSPYSDWITTLSGKAGTFKDYNYAPAGAIAEGNKAVDAMTMALYYYSSDYDIVYADATCDALAYAFTHTDWEWANRSEAGNATADSGDGGGQQNYGLGTTGYDYAFSRKLAAYGIAYDLVHDYMVENCSANLTTFRDSYARALADYYLQLKEYYIYTAINVDTGESYSLYFFDGDAGLARIATEAAFAGGSLAMLDYDGQYQDLDGSPYDWLEFAKKDMFDVSLAGATETELQLQCSEDGFFEDSEYYQYYEPALISFLNMYNATFGVNLNETYPITNTYAMALQRTATPVFVLANYITAYRSIWIHLWSTNFLFSAGSVDYVINNWYLNNSVAHIGLSTDRGYFWSGEADGYYDTFLQIVTYNQTAVSEPTGEASYMAPKDTYAVFRSDWTENSLYSLYKTAEHGKSVTAGTAVASSHQNSFDIWSDRAYLLPDSGQVRWADSNVNGGATLPIRAHSNKMGHNTWAIENSAGTMLSMYRSQNSQYASPLNPSKMNESFTSTDADYASQMMKVAYGSAHSDLGSSAVAIAENFTWTRHLLMVDNEYFISLDDVIADGPLHLRSILPLGSTEFVSTDGKGDDNNPLDNYANGTIYIDGVLTEWYNASINTSINVNYTFVQNITWSTWTETNDIYNTNRTVNLSVNINPARKAFMNAFTYINTSYMHWGRDRKGYDFARPDIRFDTNVTTFRNLIVYQPVNETDTAASFKNLTVTGGSGDDYATMISIGNKRDIVIAADSGSTYSANYLGTDCGFTFARNDTSTGADFFIGINGTNITIDGFNMAKSNETFKYINCNVTADLTNRTCKIKNTLPLNMTFYVSNSSTAAVSKDGNTQVKGTVWDENGATEIWVVMNFSSEIIIDITSSAAAASSSDAFYNVTLNYPNDGFPTNNQSPVVWFKFNGTAATASCRILNGTHSLGIDSSVVNDTLTPIQINETLSEGIMNWWIECTNASDTSNSDQNWTIDVDLTAPDINFITPMNTTQTTINLVFNVSASEIPGVLFYSLNGKANTTPENTIITTWVGNGGMGINSGQSWTMTKGCGQTVSGISMGVVGVAWELHPGGWSGSIIMNMTAFEGRENLTDSDGLLYFFENEELGDVSQTVPSSTGDSTYNWTFESPFVMHSSKKYAFRLITSAIATQVTSSINTYSPWTPGNPYGAAFSYLVSNGQYKIYPWRDQYNFSLRYQNLTRDYTEQTYTDALVEGTNTITAYVMDDAGNLNSSTVNFYADTMTPTVTEVSQSEITCVPNPGIVRLTWTQSDNLDDLTAYCNFTTAAGATTRITATTSAANSSSSCAMVLSTLGQWDILVHVEDYANNTANYTGSIDVRTDCGSSEESGGGGGSSPITIPTNISIAIIPECGDGYTYDLVSGRCQVIGTEGNLTPLQEIEAALLRPRIVQISFEDTATDPATGNIITVTYSAYLLSVLHVIIMILTAGYLYYARNKYGKFRNQDYILMLLVTAFIVISISTAFPPEVIHAIMGSGQIANSPTLPSEVGSTDPVVSYNPPVESTGPDVYSWAIENPDQVIMIAVILSAIGIMFYFRKFLTAYMKHNIYNR